MSSGYEVIPASNGYMEQIRQFSSRPIRSDPELEAATNVLEALSQREGLDDEAYLSLLVDIIMTYESVPMHRMGPTCNFGFGFGL